MNEKEYIQKILSNIKKIRIKNGLTQEQLGDNCGLEKQHIYRIESGRTSPTLKTLIKLAKALDVELSDLLK